jgi:capsular exopolysaccharide synthesis family protein
MSNRFDALRKESVLGFGELLTGRPDESKAGMEPPRTGLRPVSPLSSAIRTIHFGASTGSPVFPFDDGQRLAAEQYQIIRTKILHDARKPQLVLVSSASSGDGKTFTSINLAASLALKAESPILLLDADLRQPNVAKSLCIPGEPGLTDVLLGRTELDAALVRAAQFPNLFVLPAGNAGGRAAELLDSSAWRLFVSQIRARFGYVIVDAPPIAMVADFDLLQLVCDGTIVVARPDHTERSACAKALGSVSQPKFLGVVLNGVEDWWLWKTPTYGYYGKDRSGRKR